MCRRCVLKLFPEEEEVIQEELQQNCDDISFEAATEIVNQYFQVLDCLPLKAFKNSDDKYTKTVCMPAELTGMHRFGRRRVSEKNLFFKSKTLTLYQQKAFWTFSFNISGIITEILMDTVD